ncbi:hypothetical protein [Konateibacter massiliensis]|uniref:hypothetical protein n=1 Tax=Konateibacter massiliensis TaxID=2002841 RepID=UPI000C15F352|nr:hypothetical protein [Konateibacter massiliensis]
MFTEKDFCEINKNQYDIIRLAENCIELKSVLTGHYWLIISCDNPKFLLFHKYSAYQNYHKQEINEYAHTRLVLRYIKGHDKAYYSRTPDVNNL